MSVLCEELAIGSGVKTLDASVKQDEFNDQTGEFVAYVSVFNSVDNDNDVVLPGSWQKSLEAHTGPNKMPVIFAHQHVDLKAWLGEVIDGAELTAGNPHLPEKIRHLGAVRIHGQIDGIGKGYDPTNRDFENHRAAYRQMRGGRLKQFSFAFGPGGTARMMDFEGKAVRGLVDLPVIEVGPCLAGVNGQTMLENIKAIQQPTEAQPTPRNSSTVLDNPDDDRARRLALLSLF